MCFLMPHLFVGLGLFMRRADCGITLSHSYLPESSFSLVRNFARKISRALPPDPAFLPCSGLGEFSFFSAVHLPS